MLCGKENANPNCHQSVGTKIISFPNTRSTKTINTIITNLFLQGVRNTTENTDKHGACKHGRYMSDDTHRRNFRGCICSGEAHKLSKNQCLNCGHFEKKKDLVDTWLNFFDHYKNKN